MLTPKQLEEERINHQGTSNGFWFAGRHTSEFNMYVEKRPAQRTAVRKRRTVSVSGRSGDLHYTEDAFENYQQPYECYFHGPKPMPAVAHAIKDWLHGNGSYQQLQDSYDPECYRMATFVGPMDIENTLNKYGRCTVVFDCAPQSFLHIGDQKVKFHEPGSLFNPTFRTALPIIKIYGNGPGTVVVGDIIVTIKELDDQITLDCEMQHAYRQVGDAAPENKNSTVRAIPFPKLGPGENIISWTGGITHIEIIPRWWTL